jgi:predicted DsbA family dithiol-disulfide isomerase
MSEALYANQDDWAQGVDPKSVFVSYAEKLGMNTDKFLADMNSSEASKFVDASLNKATEMGLQSTPSFFINGKKIASPNSYDELKKLIEDALQNESTK